MKKNGNWKGKTLYSAAAVVLFVVLLLLFFPGDREYQRIPYDVVFLGDSVYGLCRDETSIAAKVQDKTGLNATTADWVERFWAERMRRDDWDIPRIPFPQPDWYVLLW